MEPCRVEVGCPVEWAIFAHVLPDVPRTARETLGTTVARYELELEGMSVVAPIRERFEVAGIAAPASGPFDSGWGHLPFAAVPSEQDATPPRHAGPWQAAGARLTEVVESWRAPVFLWPWRNPHPERSLERIVLHPSERRVLLCAVTLSGLEESPFPRDGARDMVVSFTGRRGGAPVRARGRRRSRVGRLPVPPASHRRRLLPRRPAGRLRRRAQPRREPSPREHFAIPVGDGEDRARRLRARVAALGRA